MALLAVVEHAGVGEGAEALLVLGCCFPVERHGPLRGAVDGVDHVLRAHGPAAAKAVGRTGVPGRLGLVVAAAHGTALRVVARAAVERRLDAQLVVTLVAPGGFDDRPPRGVAGRSQQRKGGLAQADALRVVGMIQLDEALVVDAERPGDELRIGRQRGLQGGGVIAARVWPGLRAGRSHLVAALQHRDADAEGPVGHRRDAVLRQAVGRVQRRRAVDAGEQEAGRKERDRRTVEQDAVLDRHLVGSDGDGADVEGDLGHPGRRVRRRSERYRRAKAGNDSRGRHVVRRVHRIAAAIHRARRVDRGVIDRLDRRRGVAGLALAVVATRAAHAGVIGAGDPVDVVVAPAAGQAVRIVLVVVALRRGVGPGAGVARDAIAGGCGNATSLM